MKLGLIILSKAFVEDTVPNAVQELELFIRIRHQIPDQLWYVQYGTVVRTSSSSASSYSSSNDVILNHLVIAQHFDSSLIKLSMLDATTVPA